MNVGYGVFNRGGRGTVDDRDGWNLEAVKELKVGWIGHRGRGERRCEV